MSKKTILVLVFFTGAILYGVLPSYWKLAELQGQKSGLEDEIRFLTTKNQILENKLRLIEDDPVYLENLARKKFHKAKEGEVIYKIVEPGAMNEDNAP
jgi:cell division protein FtsB